MRSTRKTPKSIMSGSEAASQQVNTKSRRVLFTKNSIAAIAKASIPSRYEGRGWLWGAADPLCRAVKYWPLKRRHRFYGRPVFL